MRNLTEYSWIEALIFPYALALSPFILPVTLLILAVSDLYDAAFNQDSEVGRIMRCLDKKLERGYQL